MVKLTSAAPSCAACHAFIDPLGFALEGFGADGRARADDGMARGAVFVPFAYYEAAANLMTNAALDPFGKIPEFKYCAVAIRRGGKPAAVSGYGTNPAPAAA